MKRSTFVAKTATTMLLAGGFVNAANNENGNYGVIEDRPAVVVPMITDAELFAQFTAEDHAKKFEQAKAEEKDIKRMEELVATGAVCGIFGWLGGYVVGATRRHLRDRAPYRGKQKLAKQPKIVKEIRVIKENQDVSGVLPSLTLVQGSEACKQDSR